MRFFEDRISNFSAGPSMMPEPVLLRAADEMLNYRLSGMSVMEMSHRSPAYQQIIDHAETSLREIMGIPDHYTVLFLQGGATLQFAMVPMNLMKSGRADYAVTGQFSKTASKEAEKFGKIHVAASSEANRFTRIPRPDELSLSHDADYFYYCSNNTIFGTRWCYIPETGKVPLVADMSSEILSRPVDVSRYGIIFAGAQKNLGPAGLTVVIIRNDLLADPPDTVPTMLNYKIMAEHRSIYNTPPTYAIYILGLTLNWIDEMGGLSAMEICNQKKAALLYDFLDQSALFVPVAQPDARSIMNVTFTTGRKDLDDRFAAEAEVAGLANLKGHRSVGGMRASIYNAMPKKSIVALVDFMSDFEEKNRV